MFKNILKASIISLALLMSGCGDSEGESRLETQQMLDNGDFAGVISKLEGSASSDDDYINLASAYIGRAGLTLTNIVSAIIVEDDEKSNDSSFTNFISALAKTSSSTAISDLSNATKNYKKVLNVNCTAGASLTTSEKDVCLFIGLVETSKSAVLIKLISGDLDLFGSGTTDDKLQASTCAITYAIDGTLDPACTANSGAQVTFTQSNQTYTTFEIIVNGKTFDYLQSDANQSVLTKDYCTLANFSTRSEYEYATKPASYYACPLNETGGPELTTAGVLTETLNGGLDSVSASASGDMEEDIDAFRCDVLGGTMNGSKCTISGKISEDKMTEYLQNQNK